ncbi:hypothetical protein [Kitasatospora cineracea]|uniref:Uncharacterized protein n=1 Tax=Kitasatospora cineracea TaxID=88074 RepID=A0A3N4R7I8_9ACTN|nr:hypothetical protein [Kitasatospora cineracea]RPE27329.1 hypothetical protein EDD38_7474 [Kitasatospora cineracea]
MTREHTPRPGATWGTTIRPVEQLVEDGQPEPQPNRETRRALARSRRTKDRTGLPDTLHSGHHLLTGINWPALP